MQRDAVPKHLRASALAVSETEMAAYQLWGKSTENCVRGPCTRLPHSKERHSVSTNVHTQIFRKAIEVRTSDTLMLFPNLTAD